MHPIKRSYRHIMLVFLLGSFVLLHACAPSSPIDTTLVDTAPPEKTSAADPTAAELVSPSAQVHSPSPAISTETPQIVQETQGVQEALELSPEQIVRTHYHLIVGLDYQQHLVTVEERLSYLNTTETALDSLVLIVEAQRIAQRFSLLTLHWQDGTDVHNHTLQDGILTIPLLQPLPAGKMRSVVLTFVYQLSDVPGILGYSSRQTNMADWYAFVPPYHPQEGWMQRKPAPVGEHLLYDLSDFLVELRLTGDTTNLVIAAPAPAEKDGDVFRYYRQNARNFTFSASPDYVLLQDAALPLYAYVFPEHASAGQMSLRCASEALLLFNNLYGDPELPQMNIVEADFPDGMEYDGLFFLNHLYFEYPGSGVQSGLCTLSVHESAHQWWHRLVENDPATQPWLDESLCTFSELLFYEQLYPDMVSWWWGYRINDFQPQGWVNSMTSDFNDYRPYVNAVYLRGAQFLDALRRSAGNPAMLNFLKAYAAEYRFGLADTDGFFRVWNNVTGVDPQPVIERFFTTRE